MTDSQPGIVFIVPYIGKLPPWFDAYLTSCEANKDIVWKFFTDCELPRQLPPNVQFHKLTLPEFNKLASRKLKMPIRINNPYKLCDLRPAYGRIFEEHLTNFDFWGHCDIDVIWGDIRRFLTRELLDRYDIISCFRDRLHGPCSLFRNVPCVNHLYTNVPGYRRVFKKNRQYHFDELHMSAYISWGIPGVAALWLELVFHVSLVMLLHSLDLYKGPVFRNNTLPVSVLYLFLGGGIPKGWNNLFTRLQPYRAMMSPQIHFYSNQFSVDPLVIESNPEGWFWKDGKVFGPQQLNFNNSDLKSIDPVMVNKLLPVSIEGEYMFFDFGGFTNCISDKPAWQYPDYPKSFHLILNDFMRPR